MADDPSPPHAPHDRDILTREVAQRDNRALFIDAMADPLRRRIAFESWRETVVSDLQKVKTV